MSHPDTPDLPDTPETLDTTTTRPEPSPLDVGPAPEEPAPVTQALPAAPATAQAPAAVALDTRDEGRVHRPLRMRTVVLGLVLLTVAATSLLRLVAGVHLDDAAVLLTLLVVAGVLLLGGGVASATREARAGRRAP